MPNVVLFVLFVLQGMKNPLDSVSRITPRAATKPEDKAHKAATGMYQYFLKVRPLLLCCLTDDSCLQEGAAWLPQHSLRADMYA
jgi:hypothetical protein